MGSLLDNKQGVEIRHIIKHGLDDLQIGANQCAFQIRRMTLDVQGAVREINDNGTSVQLVFNTING